AVNIQYAGGEASSARGQFRHYAFVRAEARAAMPDAFHDRHTETFHDRRVNGKIRVAVLALQHGVVHDPEPLNLRMKKRDFRNIVRDLESAGISVADQNKLPAQVRMILLHQKTSFY